MIKHLQPYQPYQKCQIHVELPLQIHLEKYKQTSKEAML